MVKCVKEKPQVGNSGSGGFRWKKIRTLSLAPTNGSPVSKSTALSQPSVAFTPKPLQPSPFAKPDSTTASQKDAPWKGNLMHQSSVKNRPSAPVLLPQLSPHCAHSHRSKPVVHISSHSVLFSRQFSPCWIPNGSHACKTKWLVWISSSRADWVRKSHP